MSKAKNWVDYKEIKANISLKMVLDRYGIELKPGGKNLVGCCPIHKGSNPRQFSVNPEKNIWHCFGNCKEGGNVLDFVAMMELGNKEPDSIREAGLFLKNWFLTSSTSDDKDSKKPQADPDTDDHQTGNKLVRKERVELGQEDTEKKRMNEPLEFELKNLDPDHSFFADRGIESAIVKHFGLGFCSKGMMKNRIAIPIHDHLGQLVAYCGRAITDEQIEEEGKYKLPANFFKSEVVYNLNRQKKDVQGLILVESYLSAWKLTQARISNVVALMGSSLSETQESLIFAFLGPAGRVLTMFDADEDGEKCTDECLRRLGRRLYIKALDFSTLARKPHQLTAEQILTLKKERG